MLDQAVFATGALAAAIAPATITAGIGKPNHDNPSNTAANAESFPVSPSLTPLF